MNEQEARMLAKAIVEEICKAMMILAIWIAAIIVSVWFIYDTWKGIFE